MSDKVYTLEEIKAIASPIARRYDIAALYLFGSYARGEATPASDLDFRVDRGKMVDMLALGGLMTTPTVARDIVDAFLETEFCQGETPERVTFLTTLRGQCDGYGQIL